MASSISPFTAANWTGSQDSIYSQVTARTIELDLASTKVAKVYARRDMEERHDADYWVSLASRPFIGTR